VLIVLLHVCFVNRVRLSRCHSEGASLASELTIAMRIESLI
jgi:hypothetical protein